MPDDMPKPDSWVSVALRGDKFFVHVREGSARQLLGPFDTNHDAVEAAKMELQRIG